MSRSAKKILIDGEYLTFDEIAKKYDVNKAGVVNRYYNHHKRGLDLVRSERLRRGKVAINGEVLTLAEVAEKYKLNKGTVRNRYDQGYRGQDLIKEVRKEALYHTEIKDTGGTDITSLAYLSQITGIDVSTLINRYDCGKRGDDLIVLPVVAERFTDIYDSNLTELSINKVASLAQISLGTVEYRQLVGYRGDNLLISHRKKVE